MVSSSDMFICSGSGSSLPLQLLTFTAQTQNKTVALQWQTTNEVNSSHFNIQRSTDGSSFSTIGRVNAKGGGSYVYADDVANINTNIIYYRIEMVDKDGSIAYSKIVSVTLTAHNSQFTIYPNPVTNQLQLRFTTGIKAHTVINIINSLGMLVKQINAGNTGAANLTINTTGLMAGVYAVQLISGDKVISTQKMIKQ